MHHDDSDDDMDRRAHPRRAEDVSAEQIRFSWHVVAWILGVMLTGFATYNATISSVKEVNAATLQRVYVLEAKQNSADQRLERMETKIDELLARPTRR